MQIILANPRGFCAGVERAIAIVERAIEKFGAPIYVRHEVVHNQFVCDNLREKGAIFVDELAGKMNWTVRQAEHRDMPTTRYGMPWEEGERDIPPADALVPSLRVLEALLADKNYPTGEDGLGAVRALVAAHVSAEENHRVVRLDEQLPETLVFPWA